MKQQDFSFFTICFQTVLSTNRWCSEVINIAYQKYRCSFNSGCLTQCCCCGKRVYRHDRTPVAAAETNLFSSTRFEGAKLRVPAIWFARIYFFGQRSRGFSLRKLRKVSDAKYVEFIQNVKTFLKQNEHQILLNSQSKMCE